MLNAQTWAVQKFLGGPCDEMPSHTRTTLVKIANVSGKGNIQDHFSFGEWDDSYSLTLSDVLLKPEIVQVLVLDGWRFRHEISQETDDPYSGAAFVKMKNVWELMTRFVSMG